MELRPNPGGPTILDINTGFLRDSNGLTNIYKAPHNLLFETDEFETYKEIQLTLRDSIMQLFGVDELYFTAPTFITRLSGTNWEPKEIHDEYWYESNATFFEFMHVLTFCSLNCKFQASARGQEQHSTL